MGITSRDALILQLFVRGYGVRAEFVGDILRRELLSAFKKLRPQIKSGYFDNTREISAGHMRGVSKQLGVLDTRSKLLGLSQPEDFYIKILRRMNAPPDEKDLLSGLLLFDESTLTFSDEIERVLRASPKQLEEAKRRFAIINALMFRPFFASSIINSPEYVAILLILFLRMEQGGFTIEQLVASVPVPDGFQRMANAFKNLLRRGHGETE